MVWIDVVCFHISFSYFQLETLVQALPKIPTKMVHAWVSAEGGLGKIF